MQREIRSTERSFFVFQIEVIIRRDHGKVFEIKRVYLTREEQTLELDINAERKTKSRERRKQ